ncbi:kelch repeat-containing protein [Micropterus dolomieu]|uniref:kelch repeat-containing protein n=1 Tax=Micropterus dolomieu TaxID=147949 RepID=UPI001E8D16C5|nr:kelch repeat-containing protein [Micropterus dolomieu]XP_045921654.1 kelch repeat-containing protein [Micropterus dolomieu]XP_045921655.1 kelch repeat-containing protein [Micropterus dolomieu]XP_045921656.1 kelch repeat-containing protein [Micropterus dolomieu]XP_045921657.1 kelch repeat-containing protein [Micropterus dolomieu]
MDDFGVYAAFGVNGPPQRLLSADGSSRVSVAVPPCVRQVVLFSSGPWGERICVNAELNDADRIPITIGKLTPYNKCLSWEQWEEETWTDSVTLNVTLEGGNLVKADWSEPELILAVKEYTPKDTVAPLAARELNGKRKRERVSEGDGDENKVTKRGEDENVCPNGAVEKTTPVRKARGQTKGGQKLFSGGGDATKMKGAGERGSVLSNGAGEAPGIVGRTPPQNAARTKSRQAKTPTHTAPLVSPSGRWGQTLCPIDAQTAILIGGQGARMQFCKDPMWKLCTEDMSWVAAETLAEGPTPEARIGHTVVYDPDSKRIFVFGGSKNKKWFNDVHILDTQSWKWTMVEAQGKVPPLAYHSCSMFRGELFVLGGVFPRPNPEPDGCSDSLYIFDPHLSIWYQPIVTGDTPSPRSGHSACVMQERKIYVFGGWDTPVCYNDMYMLDLGLMEFSAVKTTGKAPSPRSWHGSAVLSDTKFLIHGGYNGNNALSDTFVFDIDTNSWTEVTLPQLSVPRAGHSIITMKTAGHHRFSEEDEDVDTSSVSRTLLVFGGGDNEGNFFSDLTTLSVEELLQAI